MNDRLLIIDGYNFVFRAYYTQPPLSNANGDPVGAVYGFTSMLLKTIDSFKPKYAVVVFDSGEKNFRHDLYDQYKANRPQSPEDLKPQFALVRKAAKALGLYMIDLAGYEADDVIATIATSINRNALEKIIISSDKDLMQLLDQDSVKMYDPIKAKYITNDDIVEKFGVLPNKIRDVMALTGDQSDNIPGVKTIGPKTAANLIRQFGSLDQMLNNIDQITNERKRSAIEMHKDLALLSFELVGLKSDINLQIPLDDFLFTNPDQEEISLFLNEHGFKSLHKRIANLFQIEIINNHKSHTPKKINQIKTEVLSEDNIKQLTDLKNSSGIVIIDIFSCKEFSQILLINVSNNYYYCQVNNSYLKDILEIIEDESVKKITYSIRALYENLENILNSQDFTIHSCESIELMKYLISGEKFHDQNKQKHEYGNLDEFLDYCITSINHTRDLYWDLLGQIRDTKLLNLYCDIDTPLSHILNQIKRHGIKIDIEYLALLSKKLEMKLNDIEQQIFQISEVEFNISSPKQLGNVLFDKMRLPFGKSSPKTKSYSTSVEILEKLSSEGHVIADLLLMWRQFTKLKNTYTDALPKHAQAQDRIHTTLLQTSTITARLSSQHPNLQNIPIRSEEGSKIRKAFIAKDNCKIISADYSQIELRIFAQMANIEKLKIAFINGHDIHSKTASDIFNISQENITSEHRRSAKAINFGIIYGISPFGLAKQLNISTQNAKEYIEHYFDQYPGIETYMQDTINYAKAHGYVKNIFNRKLFIPSINDKNFAIRQFAQRSCINAPIQSTSADMIKIAMIDISSFLQKNNFKTKILLQIHDELLFEAPEDEIDQVVQAIKRIMETNSILQIPIIVDITYGNTWLS
ncbi:MAG: DNA polymerase I [Rickettsiaceae bacterium]